MTTSKIISGMVIGAVIGGAVAFLFGTDEGKGVRKHVGETAEDTWEEAAEIFETILDKMDEYLKRRK